MITVHDSTIKKYIYFDRIKRLEISLKFVINTEIVNVVNSINTTKFTCSTNFTNSIFLVFSVLPIHSMSPINSTSSISFKNKLQYLQKLYVLEHYNKEMDDSDNHIRLNSYYSVSRHYHRRN